jgi:hypothetical protein
MKWFFYSLGLLFCTVPVRGQDPDLPFGNIVLDSFTVTAVRHGLDINDLIEIMQFDSTLYIAFNNLHFTEYTYENDLQAFHKGERDAAKQEVIRQNWNGTCRSQLVEALESDGSFENRRGNDKYYTVELFDRTFYTDGEVCHEKRKGNWKEMIYGDKKEGHLAAIKRVVFNPGSPVDLPIIGKKFDLFDPSMMKYYQYAIDGKKIDGEDCYEFTIEVKPEYADSRKDVIVRKLRTAFRTSDFQVMRRDYVLYYQGAMVKVDIKMNIALAEKDSRFYPASFQYDGQWKVPTKKLEDIEMRTDFFY